MERFRSIRVYAAFARNPREVRSLKGMRSIVAPLPGNMESIVGVLETVRPHVAC
jgi:hypothetical protein